MKDMRLKMAIVLIFFTLIIGAGIFYFGGNYINKENLLQPITPIIDNDSETGGAETDQTIDSAEGDLDVSPEEPEAPGISPADEPTEEAGPEKEESKNLLLWKKENGIRVLEAVSSSTIFKDSQYWMYYTGIEGIRLAKSSDGIAFQDHGVVVNHGVLGSEQEFVTNPSVFSLNNGKHRMIYEGSKDQRAIRKLFSAVSDNGMRWTKESGVRLEDSIVEIKGGINRETIFTSVPDVIRLNNGCLRMYYTVIDESRIAESCDDGLIWQKRGKIMFDNYPEVVQDPDIIQLDNGKYKLFFSTQDFGRTRQWILSAVSDDGINFIVDDDKRLEPSAGKTRAVDPDVVELSDGSYRMYYGESLTFEDGFNILSAISQD